MKKFFSLCNVIFKSGNFFGSSTKKKKNRYTSSSWIFVLLLLVVIAGAIAFSNYVQFRSYLEIGLIYEGEKMIYVSSLTISLVIAFILSFATFFMSGDDSRFLSLPLKPLSLFWARFFVTSLMSLMMAVAFIIPSYIVINIFIPFNAWTLISLLISLLYVLIIGEGLAFIIGNLVGLFINIGRHKNIFLLLVIVFSIGLYALCFLSGFFVGDLFSSIGDIQEMPDPAFSIFEVLTPWDFLLYLPLVSLTSSSLNALIYALYTLLTILGLFLLLCLVAHTLYLGNLLKGLNGTSKRKINREKEEARIKKSRNGTPFLAHLSYEIKTSFRSMVLIFNSYFPNLLMLVISAVIYGLFLFSGLEGGAKEILTIVLSFALYPIAFVTPSISAFNFSKDGNSHYLLMSLPLKKRNTLLAKSLSGFLSNFLIFFVFSLLLLISNVLPPLESVLMLLSFFFIAFYLNGFDFLLDGLHPSFDWSSETQYVKRPSVFLPHMGLVFGRMALSFVFYFSFLLNGINPLYALIALLAIDVVLFVLPLLFIKKIKA